MIIFICLQQKHLRFGVCWFFSRLHWPAILYGYFIAEEQLAEVNRDLANTDEKKWRNASKYYGQAAILFYFMTANLFLCTNQLENSYI